MARKIAKYCSIFLLFLILFAGSSIRSMGQTCSVNAGVGARICKTGTMSLSGNATGALATTATWALVSGPNVPVITTPANPNTTVTGFNAGTYIFRYYAKCSDSITVSDSVTVVVDSIPPFTAGRDTFVCGSSVPMKATLPAGTTGAWTIFRNPSSPYTSLGGSISSASSPTATLTLGGSSGSCPKILDAVWTVSSGVCRASDTAAISLGGQTNYTIVQRDTSICGTSYYHMISNVSIATYFFGCGGGVDVVQLAGPSAATIVKPTAGSGFGSISYSNLNKGTYTFAYAITPCSGPVFRDTFDLTVTETVAVSVLGGPVITACPQDYDTVYYLTPFGSLLPGETLTWNLSAPTIKNTPGATVANPVVDTVGTTLRLRNVVHPGSTATGRNWVYAYQGTISNGVCSRTITATLNLVLPITLELQPVINLACGLTSTELVVPVAGTGAKSNHNILNNATVISKPAGAPDPVITSFTIVSGLVPGKYLFEIEYFRGFTTCGMRSAVVEVNVAAPTGASNAGTDQVLPCGVDSSTLAGNTPPAGQKGTWQLVSGPSSVVLTNPNSPSLLIKNLSEGVYTFRWSIASGITCTPTSDIMQVAVTPNPPVSTAGPDRTVCYGYGTALNGNLPGLGASGRWRQISGPPVTIADSTAARTSFSGSVASSVYTFSWNLTNVCGSGRDTVVITTTAFQGPSDARILNSDSCITTTATAATLRAAAITSGTGVWRQLSGPATTTIASPSAATTNVTGMSANGEYRFTWTVTAPGCDTLSDTVSISRRTTALTANAGPDIYVCADTIRMNATTPTLGTGTWSQISGAATVIANPASPTSGVSGLSGGGTYDYLWTVQLGFCPAAMDTVHVATSVPPSAAVAMRDTLICGHTQYFASSMSLPLTATAPASGVGAWTVLESPRFGCSISNAGAASTTGSFYGGVTRLAWTVVSGTCPVSRDTVRVEIVPAADANGDQDLCEQVSYSVTATQPGAGTARWSQVSGPSVATITQPDDPLTTITGLETGVYRFRYAVSHPSAGCSSEDTITISNYEMPVAHAGRDSLYCYNPSGATQIYLLADSPVLGSGVWDNLGPEYATYTPGPDSFRTTASVTRPGLYQFIWYLNNGGCYAQDYVDINVMQITVPPISFAPQTACKDSFEVSVANPYPNMYYAWSFQRATIRDTAGINLKGPFSNHFVVSDTNNIYLTITDPSNGCSATDSLAVIVDCHYLPLPLDLLDFTAMLKDGNALLQWYTANERQVDRYEVERSSNGTDWRPLGYRKALGGNAVYAFTDTDMPEGVQLYRLRIYSQDGSDSYSPVRMLRNQGNGADLLVYPNPASQQLQVLLPEAGTGYSFELFDATGRSVQSGVFTESLNRVDVRQLAAGSYLIRINKDGTSVTSRLVRIVR